MKIKNIPVAILLMSIGAVLSACGSTKVVDPNAAAAGASTANSSPTIAAPTSTFTSTSTGTNTNTNTSVGSLPILQYSISQTGNQVYVGGSLNSTQSNCGSTCSSSYTTASISTDNVLKIKFRVGTYEGNNVGQAQMLKVAVSVNGQTYTPTYESSNYSYGLVNEMSNSLDLSGAISPGVPTTIKVLQPMNDWYCVIWDYGLNNLYNNYPACYKTVYQNHTWSGILYVQTSNTVDISNAK